MRRVRYKQSGEPSRTKILTPGQLIPIDLCGSMQSPSIGELSTKLFEDDFSNYRTVYFLRDKRESYENIGKFIPNEIDRKSKTFITKNGAVSRGTNDLLSIYTNNTLHLRIKRVKPDETWGEWVRALVEAARVMIHQKNPSKKYWAEAINRAVHDLSRVKH